MDGEIRINVIVLGDNYVGKSSIIKRIQKGIFQESYPPTICVEPKVINRRYKAKKIIITFYDTPGQESLQFFIPKQNIRDSHIVLLVFCDINTLNEVKKRWYKFYKDNANIENSIFILVGNKSDIFGNERDEIIKQGEKFAEDIDAHFITCSAKIADNMDNLDRYITTEAKRFIDNEEKRKKYYEEHPKNKSNEGDKIKFAEEYL